MKKHNLKILLAIFAVVLSFSIQTVAQSDWLDMKPLPNWNSRSRAILQTKKMAQSDLTRCRNFVRTPSLPPDQLLARYGWTLVGSAQVFGRTTVVTVAESFDGMCRPLKFQTMVFVGNRVAGTLSPGPMDSRTDGSLANVRLLSPSMAFTIAQGFKGNISDENLIKRLALAAVLMRSKNSLENVITPRFKKALQTLDTSDPVIREMQKSDCYDWSPRAKMLLINLTNDKVVDSGNTEKAFRTMRRRGVGADTLRRYTIEDANLNHLNAIGPALVRARRFFDEGFGNLDN